MGEVLLFLGRVLSGTTGEELVYFGSSYMSSGSVVGLQQLLLVCSSCDAKLSAGRPWTACLLRCFSVFPDILQRSPYVLGIVSFPPTFLGRKQTASLFLQHTISGQPLHVHNISGPHLYVPFAPACLRVFSSQKQ